MKGAKRLALGAVVSITILVPLSADAEEGGSGHYMPGAAASFIDTLPGKPGLAVANFFNFYDGGASASKQVVAGGLATAGLDATAYSDSIVAFYKTPLKLLGGYYSVAVAIPFVWVEAKGEVQVTGPLGTLTSTKRDKANGIGDILGFGRQNAGGLTEVRQKPCHNWRIFL